MCKFNIGDRVRVVTQLHGHDYYPWIPCLIGKEGKVVKIFHFDEEDDSVFTIQMDESFERGWVPEGEHAFDYVPEETESSDLWHFVDEELENV